MSTLTQAMLAREQIANRPKHWVRLVTACNNRCLFCLDMDTPRNVYLSVEEIQAELRHGRETKDAWKVILSGGEASLHPKFPEIIRYAHEIGYGRVQTVTNGLRYAEKAFFQDVMEAGLNEITFSLHGHTAELHDHLVQCPGSFRKLIKGLIRAKRDGRPIVNIDVVINKQNVAHIDQIVALGTSLGVREYDLLHVIPQAAAYRNRDQMFYDVREHLPRLQKVFALNRQGYYIWTNRFPVSYLEGMEDLIQDPHKMLDEVNGRRYQVRRYLDHGLALDCREPDRCQHCFIEPFCNTMDSVVESLNSRRVDVWQDTVVPEQLPHGARQLGWACDTWEELPTLPENWGFYAQVAEPGPVPWTLPDSSTVVVSTSAQLDGVLTHPLPDWVELEIRLNQDTGAWLLAHREALSGLLNQVRLHQPTHERMEAAVSSDLRNPAGFFLQLDLPVRVSGLPACLAPGSVLAQGPQVIDARLFEEHGCIDIDSLARLHVKTNYRAKSVRCQDCRVNDRCEGLHINAIRDQGLGLLTPLGDDAWGHEAAAQLEACWPTPPVRVRHGRPLEPAHDSLPGHPPPGPVPEDPLARKRGLKRSDFWEKTRIVQDATPSN